MSLLLLVVIPALAVLLFRQWDCCRRDAMLAGALLVGNATVVRWASLAYSEHWCLALLLAEAVVLGGRGGSPWRRVLLAGFLGGWAVATRAEAALLQPLFFAVDWRGARHLFSLPRFATWTALVLAPVSAWALWAAGGPAALHYVDEASEGFTLLAYNHSFVTMAASAVRDLSPAAPNFPHYVGMKLLWFVFIVSMALALRGFCGAAARWSAVALLAYWLIHATWHYSSERYNIIVAPLIAFVMARAIGWFADRGMENPPPAAPWIRWGIFGGIVLLQTQWSFLNEVRQHAIRQDLSDAESQLVANELRGIPGAMLTNRAANFAYWQDREVWFGWDVRLFNRGLLQDHSMEEIVREKNITLIVLDQPAAALPEAAWLADMEAKGGVRRAVAGRLHVYHLPKDGP